MKADYVHKDTLTATDYVELNKNNELLISYNQELLKENQELKLELSGYRQAILNNKEMLGLKEQNEKLKQKYLNAVSDYETTMAEKEQLNSLVNSCQEEIRQLKKQLEVSNELVAQGTLTEMKLRNEVNRWRKEYQDTYKDVRIEIKEYKTQQKEFINYLEDEKDRLARECSNIYEDSLGHTRLVNEDIFNEINDVLQKYREIIGE